MATILFVIWNPLSIIVTVWLLKSLRKWAHGILDPKWVGPNIITKFLGWKLFTNCRNWKKIILKHKHTKWCKFKAYHSLELELKMSSLLMPHLINLPFQLWIIWGDFFFSRPALNEEETDIYCVTFLEVSSPYPPDPNIFLLPHVYLFLQPQPLHFFLLGYPWVLQELQNLHSSFNQDHCGAPYLFISETPHTCKVLLYLCLQTGCIRILWQY